MTDGMLRYPNKAAYAQRYFSVDATKTLPDGVTLTGATLSIALYEYSKVTDDDPDAMVSGDASVNADNATILGRIVSPGCGASCLIIGGEAGATYIATWEFAFSDSIQRDAVSAIFSVY